MSLRARLTVISCATIVVAVVLVSVLGYATVRRQLLDSVDRQLDQRASYAVPASSASQRDRDGGREPLGLPGDPRRTRGGPPLDPFADPDTAFQVIDSAGTVVARPGGNPVELPVDDEDRAVAAAPAGTRTVRTVAVEGGDERVLTVAAGDGLAVQVSRSLDETDETLDTLVLLFAAVGAAVTAVAVVTGYVATSRSLRPIGRLTDAAEEVARTQDVAVDLGTAGADEVGRLAAAFNEMLHALAGAREQQRRLVADASHELRTPLTALRTNIEVLSRAAARGQLAEVETRSLMEDVREELEALSTLVAEIVDLATDASAADGGRFEDVELGPLAEEVARRASRRYGVAVTVREVGDPSTVRAVRPLLERALSNLLDNAAKWDRSGLPLVVEVRGARLAVRDHGPGLGSADPSRLFDRFYRGPGAQATPGSGLGLAIVQQVVERHCGSVFAEESTDGGGGAIVGFELWTRSAADS